jgi:hypothetical protein
LEYVWICYSAFITLVGSTLTARMAGISVPIEAAAKHKAEATENIKISQGFNPANKLCSHRPDM